MISTRFWKMYPQPLQPFSIVEKILHGINCRRVGNIIQNFRIVLNPTFFVRFASFPKLGIWYDRPCSLEMKYLFASDCYFKKVAGQRDLEERVRLTVSSSTSFFDCKNVRVSVFHSLQVRLIELQLSYSSNTMSNLAT